MQDEFQRDRPFFRIGARITEFDDELVDLIDDASPKRVLRTQKTELMKAKTLVELFGQGGQFVSYGIHPATDRPYRWLGPGMEPATVPTRDSEPELSLRVFGKTELKKISNTAMYFATGNNLMFTGDMVRRALRCTIDAGCERPEERKFKTVRLDTAMANTSDSTMPARGSPR